MKALTLNCLLVIGLASSFSFANWGAYQYMKNDNPVLPISNAVYFKDNGTLCVADFEDQSDLLAQLKSLDSTILVTECNDEDVQQINNQINYVANEYLYNGHSFLVSGVTKLPMPPQIKAPLIVFEGVTGVIKAYGLGSIVSVGAGCLISFLAQFAETDDSKDWLYGAGMALGIQPSIIGNVMAMESINSLKISRIYKMLFATPLFFGGIVLPFVNVGVGMYACSDEEIQSLKDLFK